MSSFAAGLGVTSPPSLWAHGPGPAAQTYSFPARPDVAPMEDSPLVRTQYPMTTGTSVFGLKYRDGVVMAADTLGSYGSLGRYHNLERIIRLNAHTMVACSGDYADFQALKEILEQKQRDAEISGSKSDTKPRAVHCWLTRFLYRRRSKFDPLWLTIIVGGLQDGEPFLGFVDQIGTPFTENCIITGFGGHLALPIIRDALEKKPHSELSLEEATDLIKQGLRLAFLRDCRANSKYTLAVVNDKEATIKEPEVIDTNWEIAKKVTGYF